MKKSSKHAFAGIGIIFSSRNGKTPRYVYLSLWEFGPWHAVSITLRFSQLTKRHGSSLLVMGMN